MSAKRLHVYRGKRRASWQLWVLLPLVALAGVGVFWWHDTAARTRPRTVEIRLETEAGEPLADTPVSGLIDTAALPVGRWGEQPAFTGQDGRCSFEQVLPGGYWLRAADNLYELHIPENAPASLLFVLSAKPDRYTAVLRLQDAQGEPVARRQVTLVETGLEEGAAISSFHTLEGETDWQGNLVLEGVRAGGHLLCPEGAAPIALVIEPNEKKSVSGLLSVYPEEDGPISKRATVYGPDAKPLMNELVTWVAYGLPGGREIALSQWETDENGQLSLSLPSPGTYTLRIRDRRLKLDTKAAGEMVSLYL